jgi:L-fuconolactonase
MQTISSRRSFLKTTAAGLAGVQLCRMAEAANDRGGADIIIDTHTHFYDPTRPEGVPWPPRNDALLYRRVMPADYRALPKPQPVTGTIVVEASPWVEDNQWILNLAADDSFIVGMVGNLAPGTDDFRSNLLRFAKNPLFRGLRIGAGPLRASLIHGRLMDDLKAVADHDLALDLLGGPEMLPDVPRLAKAIPGLRLIIDHVANIRIDGRAADKAWLEGMEAAGQHHNVFCKVSGLVEGTGRSDGTAPERAEFYRPVLDGIWEAFGAARLVYGSNWPVSERFASCYSVQQIVCEYFTTKGQAALNGVFWRNAKALYKWGGVSPDY